MEGKTYRVVPPAVEVNEDSLSEVIGVVRDRLGTVVFGEVMGEVWWRYWRVGEVDVVVMVGGRIVGLKEC